ncbi:hypothetical protein O6H91_13G023800 [Diphasiastrum complanatum]|uniref:Uncharacterized protein n=1 Tax=Diphasiastrum complanatum TaxID=34168 RepID=A0ACC2BT62_DIPCM|nr:hypothetical protein O6H91_13G023800 [Diphasiastrum complanatum]
MAVFSATGAVASGQFAGILQVSSPSQGLYWHSPQSSCVRKGVHVHSMGDASTADEATLEYGTCRCSYLVKFSCICSEHRVVLSSRSLSRQSLIARGLKSARISRGKQYQTTKCIRLASVADEIAVKTLEEDENSSKRNSSLAPNNQRNEQQGDLPALKTPPRPAPRPILGLGPEGAASEQTRREMNAYGNGHQSFGNVNSRPNFQPKAENSMTSGNSLQSSGGSTARGIISKAESSTDSSNSVQSLDQILKKAEKLGSEISSQAGNRQSGVPASRAYTRQNQYQRQSSQTQWRRSKENEEGKTGLQSTEKTSVEQPQAAGSSASADAVKPPEPVLSNPPLLRPSPLIKPKPVLVPRPAVAPQPPQDARARPQMVDRKPQMVDRNRRTVEEIRPGADAAVRPGSDQQSTVRRQPILRDVGAAPKSKNQEPAVAEPRTKDLATPPKSKTADAVAEAGNVVLPSKPAKLAPSKGKEDRRNKLTEVMDGAKRRGARVEKGDGNVDSVATSGQRGRKYTKARRKAERVEAAKAAAPVRVDILEVGKQGMSVQDLAHKLAVNDGDVVKTLFMKGIVTTVNQILDEETVKLVCKEFEVEVIEAGSLKVAEMAKKTIKFAEEDDLDFLQLRPPVVTIMGHVDHGKTSLLDYIRKSKVAASEAGGITQGIGAYRVLVPVGGADQACVFLDTPGHEAFSAMRARGARVTDVAIIVVAADDGVRPQTIEAIAHAKAANVPTVVAINKIDKEGANPERVMQELSTAGLMPEDWGGDVAMVQVSALTGENVDQLLETVMLVAEFQDLKANANRSAKGTVIEASLDKTRGAVATFLVQNGTLRKGDVVLCGRSYGKVRALLDDTGARVNEAGPSTAVQVMGLNIVPVAGDEFEIIDSLDQARQKAAECGEVMRDAHLAALAGEGKLTLASLASAVASAKEAGVESHQLNVILKVDVQAAGDIHASDIDLAVASQAIVIGFKVGIQPDVQAQAEKEGVEIRIYKVIYELIEDMRQAMEGLLQPIEEQVSIGKAEVRAVFSSGSGKVAGCIVTEGKLVKSCGVKVIRGKTLVLTAALSSLRRVKEAAKEVNAGLECGVGIDNFDEWQEGDIIEAFNMVAKKKTLEDASASVTSTLSAS